MQLYETIYIVKQDLDNKALKDLEEKYGQKKGSRPKPTPYEESISNKQYFQI